MSLAIAEAKRRGISISLPENAAPVGVITPDQQAELDKCDADFIYFCNHYGWVIEPRPPVPDGEKDLDFTKYLARLKRGENMPPEVLDLLPLEMAEVGTNGGELRFKLWDYQKELAHWFNWLVEIGESGAVEKSRDMGFTWLFSWWLVWRWRFRRNFSALLGSKKEAAVDNGKLSSIFGKLDYAIEKLPDWMKPAGYNRKKNRTKLSITNPENGNYLVGDSQTPDFGRGERHTVVIPDEDAWWDFDPSGSISQVTNTAIYGSSVNGDNHFKRLRDRFEARGAHLVKKLEWFLNPTHTKEWFARMQATMDEADFAREVLIDYKASVKGKYYPICNLVTKLPEIQWQPGWPSVISIDYGVKDNAAFVWWQKDPRPGAIKPHKMMYSYSNNGKPIRFYLPFLKAEMPEDPMQVSDENGYLIFDNAGNPVMVANPFEYNADEITFIQRLISAGVTDSISYRGDPAGSQRSQQTAIGVETALERAGIYVYGNGKENDYASRRAALTDVLMNAEVNMAGAYEAFNAIAQSKYPERRENSNSTSSPNAPVHDWTSHYRSAAEYYAVGELETDGTTSGSVIIMSARM